MFSYFVILNYFSEANISKINNNRLNFDNKVNDYQKNLQVLKNDTNNVISYNTESLIEKKIKKRNFWELLNNNE